MISLECPGTNESAASLRLETDKLKHTSWNTSFIKQTHTVHEIVISGGISFNSKHYHA